MSDVIVKINEATTIQFPGIAVAGRAGTNGTNGAQWRVGSGAPDNSVGADGDLYLDGDTGDVYQRASGTYTVVGNIRGPQGVQGFRGIRGPESGETVNPDWLPSDEGSHLRIWNSNDTITGTLGALAHTFADSSGNGYDFTQATDYYTPAVAASGIGSRKCLHFVTSCLTSTFTEDMGDFCEIIALKMTTLAPYGRILDSAYTQFDVLVNPDGTGIGSGVAMGGPPYGYYATIDTGNWHTLMVWRKAGVLKIYVDFGTPTVGSVTADTVSISAMNIGAALDLSSFAVFDLLERVRLDRAPDDTGLLNIQSYFQSLGLP